MQLHAGEDSAVMMILDLDDVDEQRLLCLLLTEQCSAAWQRDEHLHSVIQHYNNTVIQIIQV